MLKFSCFSLVVVSVLVSEDAGVSIAGSDWSVGVVVVAVVVTIGRVVTWLVSVVSVVVVAWIPISSSQQRISVVAKSKVLGLKKTTLKLLIYILLLPSNIETQCFRGK